MHMHELFTGVLFLESCLGKEFFQKMKRRADDGVFFSFNMIYVGPHNRMLNAEATGTMERLPYLHIFFDHGFRKRLKENFGLIYAFISFPRFCIHYDDDTNNFGIKPCAVLFEKFACFFFRFWLFVKPAIGNYNCVCSNDQGWLFYFCIQFVGFSPSQYKRPLIWIIGFDIFLIYLGNQNAKNIT